MPAEMMNDDEGVGQDTQWTGFAAFHDHLTGNIEREVRGQLPVGVKGLERGQFTVILRQCSSVINAINGHCTSSL